MDDVEKLNEGFNETIHKIIKIADTYYVMTKEEQLNLAGRIGKVFGEFIQEREHGKPFKV